jgi:ABC-type oligopeptide transport system ATPase subunit
MELLLRRTSVPKFNHLVRLYVCGDWHVGARGCDHASLERTIRHIEKDTDGYVILMGDLAECINKKDRRHDSNAIHPRFKDDLNNLIGNQERYCRKLLQPLAKENRILALLQGNHERAFELKDDYSMSRNLCEDLDVPYGGYSCVLAWNFRLNHAGGRRIIIHAHHGAGGGRTRGSKLNKLEAQEQVIEGADIYLRAHAHHKITDRDTAVGVGFESTGKPKLKERKIVLAACGSFLKTLEEGVSGYSEVAEYKPVDLGAVYVEINPFKPTERDGKRLNLFTLDVRDLMI